MTVREELEKKYGKPVQGSESVRSQLENKYSKAGFPVKEPDEVKRSFLSKITKISADLGIGFSKGVADTVSNASVLGQKALNKVTDPLVDLVSEGDNQAVGLPESVTEASNPTQQTGKTIEKIAEFFVPTGAVVKAGQGANKAIKGLDLAAKFGKRGEFLESVLNVSARSGIEAGTTGGVTAIQEGGTENVKRNALFGAGVPVIGKILSKGKQLYGKIATSAGEKIQMSVIKPSVVDIRDGFKIENLEKYDLGGSLSQSFTKVNQKMNELSQELKSIITDSDAKVDLVNVYSRTLDELGGKTAESFGQNKNLSNVVGKLLDEIAIVADDGVVDLSTAQAVKRAAGTQGSWVFGVVDPEARAVETVYSKFYSVLKEEIEKASGQSEAIKIINKQLSDLIPINNAIVRRIPVAERNNAIGLTDALGLFATVADPKIAAVVVVNKASKSGRVGKALVKSGKKAINKTSKTSVGKRIFGR